MEHLKMQTANKADENYRKLSELFPNAVTETIDENGEVVRAIDKDVLMQEIAVKVVDGREERYQFTWPDKKKSVLLANAPISKTLRPCREESVDFDNTENLYIEGDNLEVLKLLQETYLGKIKMIYIDPPYNTGNDFVYEDDFSVERGVWRVKSGDFDEDGNRMVQNTESNGRFHTDWLNMIYPRLRLAKDLLTDDGVIFISIDDNEVDNLKKCCDEVFGEQNCLGIVTWAKKRKGSFLSKKLISLTEYCVVYSKNSENVYLFGGKAEESESQPIIKRTNPIGKLRFKANSVTTKLQDGIYPAGTYGEDINPVILENEIKVESGIIISDFVLNAHFIWSQNFLDKELEKGGRIVINTANFQPRAFRVYGEENFKGFGSFVNGVSINGTNEDAYEELEKIFGAKKIFDYSKPKNYIKEFIKAGTNFDKNSIILDFFSGSASTAHAVMQLNAEDGGHRKFIMVQLPEKTDEKSEAYKAGYKNICEIGKERIRRAGEKILADFQGNREKGLGNRKFVGGENDSRLQGSGGLAKGHGSCEAGLSAGERTSEGRDLCLVGSNAQSSRVDSVEHRGGECPEFGQRICAISEHSEGLEGGIGNATSALQGNRLSDADGNSAAARATERNRQDDKRNDTQTPKLLPTPSSLIPTLDIGFRVLKCDTSNMKDVYYAADDYSQDMIKRLESNIKEDRTDLDLLFGCLIDWGLPLSLPYKSEQIDGCTVHTYNDGDLIACFDANVPESVVKEIAGRKPLRAVFRDAGFASSPEKINVFEIFKLYMPEDAHDIGKRVRVI